MKNTFLFLLLAIPGYSAIALESSSNSQQQAIPQIRSQTIAPTASQEAIAACSGLYEKDSCQFHTSNALLNGTCKILPSGNNNYDLGCQPEPSIKNAATDSAKDAPKTREPHQHNRKRG